MRLVALVLLVSAPLPFMVPPAFAQKQAAPTPQPAPPNPNIDMDAYVRSVNEVAIHRAKRRLTEADFIKMSEEAGTITLDARSKDKFALLHIKGAINLSFPDITIDSLKKTLPDKEARILIYCNNNFKNANEPFPPKAVIASLNISTYIALYNYGYRNVYELGPLLDPAKSKLTFEGKLAAK
ncbi:rhodanese-like domain-containing protein [Fimbriiglobus ruber]|uniref:Rhodanese-related thiosulfate sulfurtransferase n=1 Tax=Fimbriiglobus ruber TaxID=1908690 RepID=A0A225D6D0_9BACT|nr:rhodanese-like domain-containing protein [Fimbriiglobus ruber]OWK36543.1 Rhodanese-related thiosulfate sulfurtransferase [Fimbriiglobus ruber]